MNTHPYRTNAKPPDPPSHRDHGLYRNAKHTGSPTGLRFCACGAVIDAHYHEVRPIPMRDWLESLEATS